MAMGSTDLEVLEVTYDKTYIGYDSNNPSIPVTYVPSEELVTASFAIENQYSIPLEPYFSCINSNHDLLFAIKPTGTYDVNTGLCTFKFNLKREADVKVDPHGDNAYTIPEDIRLRVDFRKKGSNPTKRPFSSYMVVLKCNTPPFIEQFNILWDDTARAVKVEFPSSSPTNTDQRWYDVRDITFTVRGVNIRDVTQQGYATTTHTDYKKYDLVGLREPENSQSIPPKQIAKNEGVNYSGSMVCFWMTHYQTKRRTAVYPNPGSGNGEYAEITGFSITDAFGLSSYKSLSTPVRLGTVDNPLSNQIRLKKITMQVGTGTETELTIPTSNVASQDHIGLDGGVYITSTLPSDFSNGTEITMKLTLDNVSLVDSNSCRPNIPREDWNYISDASLSYDETSRTFTLKFKIKGFPSDSTKSVGIKVDMNDELGTPNICHTFCFIKGNTS